GTGRVYFLRRTARAVPRFSCWPHLLGKETRPMTTTQAPLATGLEQIGETTTLAVSYLRVSTKEQASKGGQDEGFSIPAQRQANRRKAHEVNAVIVEEFADADDRVRQDPPGRLLHRPQGGSARPQSRRRRSHPPGSQRSRRPAGLCHREHR